MSKGKSTVKFMCLMVCLLVLTGCDRSAEERNKAIAEAEQAKAELARVEVVLKDIQNERDELKANLAIISENMEKTNSELIPVNQTLQGQVNRLTSERDSAVSRAEVARLEAEKLSKQLKEETKANLEYQEWVKELQATIEGLEAQIKVLSEMPVEQVQKEMVEEEQPQNEMVGEE